MNRSEFLVLYANHGIESLVKKIGVIKIEGDNKITSAWSTLVQSVNYLDTAFNEWVEEEGSDEYNENEGE